MKKIGVYVLKGERYYVGSTNDLERRLKEHRTGNCSSTRRIGDWQLELFIPFDDSYTARQCEIKIKRTKNIRRFIMQYKSCL